MPIFKLYNGIINKPVQRKCLSETFSDRHFALSVYSRTLYFPR
ncbi:hypothetical protein HMPREF9370_2125 [Neisseria wadsworthii 9715]|uniref:Uncharacterized protein n=1 Tax=Neisseria wadsworthii 9715 TaxID=1030841 RepID=G4CSP3_9NEIS|nr:hypothetical protein HMPREF9370_2125 [Neisseria wadsworthii 9715]